MLLEVKLCLDRDFITLKTTFPICLLAQNTMNNNSEDVVKNVESNVESTSNEQRQINKPIVISRRRLLKAGVAGIPVVLTMAGVAPAASIQTEPSAASAMWYGGNAVYNRFAGDNTIVKDGLVWTDHNGFVLLEAGGVKTGGLTVTTDSTSTGETTFQITGAFNGAPQDDPGNPPTKTFTVSVAKPTSLSMNAYLHKTGEWYTDRIVRTGTPTELLDYIEGLELTIKDGSTELNSSNTNVTNFSTTPDDASFTSTGDDWYKTVVQGWNLENTNQGQNYYLLPASTESSITSVNYNAKVSFTYVDGNYTYSCTDQPIQISLKLNVSGIPGQIDPGGI